MIELVSYVAGERRKIRPQCMCPMLAEYIIVLNFWIPDEFLPRLNQYVLPLSKSRGDSNIELRRAYVFIDHALRVFLPLALEGSGYIQEATQLRSLTPIVDQETAQSFLEFRKERLGPIGDEMFPLAANSLVFLLNEDTPLSWTVHLAAILIIEISKKYSLETRSTGTWTLTLDALEEALAIR